MASPASKIGGKSYLRGGKNTDSAGRITDMVSPADGAQSKHHWAPKDGPSFKSKGEPPRVSDRVAATPVSMTPKRQVHASGSPRSVSDTNPTVPPADQQRYAVKPNVRARDGKK